MSATIAPCTRDPRTRTDLPLDPRLQSSASSHQTAVVLPTQTKPSSTAPSQPDSATQPEQTASSAAVENIFDRLLKDLNPVKSEPDARPSSTDSRTYSAVPGELKTGNVSGQSDASKDPRTAHKETDDIRKLGASPRPATEKSDDEYRDSKNKSEELQLKSSLSRASSHSPKPSRAETLCADTKQAVMVCDETVGPSCLPDTNRDSDEQDRLCGGPKSSRRRATSQDREKSRGDGRRTADVRVTEKDAGPVAKRMRREKEHDELKTIDSPDSLPNDFT